VAYRQALAVKRLRAGVTTFSRDELFDKVWSQPLAKVAAELGLSDTAVRKMCGRYDIPVPSRGYWAQVAAGRTFPRPKLRSVKNPRLESITFVGVQPAAPAVMAAVDRVKAARPPKALHSKADKQGLAPDTALPAEAPLEIHPQALRAQTRLVNANGTGLTSVKGRGLFTVTASIGNSMRPSLCSRRPQLPKLKAAYILMIS
jgi:hypothetical protein